MLRDMLHARRFKSAPWLVATLVAMLILGHVCDLPAFANLAVHTVGPSHHHEAEHRSDDSRISCGVGDATNTTYADVRVLQPVAIGSISDPVPMCTTEVMAQGSIALLSRPPLFLLHSTLLI